MSDLPLLPQHHDNCHKGDCGRVLTIAGSAGMTGAGALASIAALRSGAGMVTWALPESLATIAELLSMEVMTLPIPETQGKAPGIDAREHLVEASREVDAVILGPGLPVAGETGELLRLVIPELHAPLILDAGGLTAVGDDWKILRKRKAKTIVTPHPGEMARLVNKGVDKVQEDRAGFATKYAKVAGVIVVLKGAETVITDGKDCFTNVTGNPGIATAGSGDVLAGIIAGLVAQGMDALAGARLGVHLHGLAGDIAADGLGTHSTIAGDILDSLPMAFITHAAVEEE